MCSLAVTRMVSEGSTTDCRPWLQNRLPQAADLGGVDSMTSWLKSDAIHHVAAASADQPLLERWQKTQNTEQVSSSTVPSLV